jgi:hypothetical protein
MKINFLAAKQPIVKAYELAQDGTLIKHPYPFVYEVTSFEENPTSLYELYQHICKYSARGACLLKGELQRKLVLESRAGTTNPETPTDWICLDLDGISGFSTVDEFLKAIGANGVDYVLQYSSSMGLENNTDLRCHIFMQLDKHTSPASLKRWLLHLNLFTPELSSQLKLTKTNTSLRWPLDVTTCQNDKLLYIAPPALAPRIKDPFPKGQRISFNARLNRVLSLPATLQPQEAQRNMISLVVAELRSKANLPKIRSAKFKFQGEIEYLANPDSANITATKTERGFTYFNLNGGDSWGYYHPENNPEFILNFKGEPTYRTQDLLPQYWAKLQSAKISQTLSSKPNAQGLIHLAFRDFTTGNYYNGSYDTNTDKLVLAPAKSETQLRQFLAQYDQALGDVVPDWTLTWDPAIPFVIDTKSKQINTYQPSTFFQLQTLPSVSAIPPTILKVISHVLDNDAATIHHFVNWLAVIVQNLKASGTAWVWQGTQGTGKGVLFHSILTPIFGAQNTVSKRMEELESEFTGFMENKFIVFIDEIEAGRSLYHSKITAKLKNLIVEPTISIRRMYTQAYMAPNHANMIFASNKPAPVEVSSDDRRFNVGPYQKDKIQLTAKEVEELIPSELEQFYAYLKAYPACKTIARLPLVSSARSQLIDISRTAIDTVSEALLKGDLEFFWDHLSSTLPDKMSPLENVKYTPYRELIIELVNTLDPRLTRDELLVLAEWCVGGMPRSPNKFTSLLKHHKLHLIQIWKGGRNVRGIDVVWSTDPKWLAQARADIAAGRV